MPQSLQSGAKPGVIKKPMPGTLAKFNPKSLLKRIGLPKIGNVADLVRGPKY